MSLSALSARRPIGTCMIFFSVLVVGLVALKRLAVDLLPSVDAPHVSITTFYEGVAPQEIETLITRPIEQVVSTVEGVREIHSTSAEGLSSISLTFAWGADLETAVNDVRAMLDRIRGRLPDDADPPSIYKFDISSMPVARLGLSGSGDPRRLRYVAEEVLSRRLEAVPGIASVQSRGGRRREIQVQLDPDRLMALGVPATDVSAALSRENRNVSAGDMEGSGREVIIRATGEFRDLSEIEDTVVTHRGGTAIRVRDLGNVVDTFQELKNELWIDGDTGIRLQVSKQSGANTVEVAKVLHKEIREINREYDGRLHLTVLEDSSDYIQASVTNVQSSALYGSALAIFILLAFLRNIRATFVIAIAIPISVMATFALMYASNISLNVISLGGLALGVGMLIDNSIVILENVYRKLEAGRSRTEAAIEGATEMALPVIAGTLTTIAVFAPVLFLEGFASVFFGEMAIVVSFALVCSLAVALSLVPALGVMMLTPVQEPPGWKGSVFRLFGGIVQGLNERFGSLLAKLLETPIRVLIVATAILLASLTALPLVGTELMPETDEGQIDLNVELPVGTPLSTTMAVMKELEGKVRGALRDGELSNITTVAGPSAAWRPGGSNEGSIQVKLVGPDDRRGIDPILADVRKAVSGTPGASIRARKGSSNMLMRLMRGGDDRLTVEIRGFDLAQGDALAERVRTLSRDVQGVTDAWIDREPGKREVAVVPDRQRLGDLGLDGKTVADALEHYILGRVATVFRDGGDEHNVRVQLADAERQRVDRLAELPVFIPGGGVVPVGAVARLDHGTGPASISRMDQERIVRVNLGTSNRPLSEITADLQGKLAGIEVPAGFRVSLGGELEKQSETFGGLVTGILLALFLVYAVLVVQFESLKQPMVIMTAVPFAAIGVVSILVLTGTTFNMNSFLGCVVLVGIAVNNSIVLVDSIGHIRATEGLGVRESAIEAGKRRLRPVLMMTATTVLGMLPLALGFGEGSEIQVPLARVIVGGLITSTLITLVFVPALYLVLEGRRERAIEPEGVLGMKPAA